MSGILRDCPEYLENGFGSVIRLECAGDRYCRELS
jgi:hypothetical protein